MSTLLVNKCTVLILKRLSWKCVQYKIKKKRLAYYNGLLCFLGDAAMTICGTTINYHQSELKPLKIYFLVYKRDFAKSTHNIFHL